MNGDYTSPNVETSYDLLSSETEKKFDYIEHHAKSTVKWYLGADVRPWGLKTFGIVIKEVITIRTGIPHEEVAEPIEEKNVYTEEAGWTFKKEFSSYDQFYPINVEIDEKNKEITVFFS